MIVVNGCPKSGCHAVMALLDTVGLKRCPGTIIPMGDGVYVEGLPVMSTVGLRTLPDNVYVLAHVPAQYSLGGFRVITVFRDPRNVLVSYCRHRKRDDALDVGVPQALENFWGQSFVELYAGFLGWRGRSVVMRYEDMPAEVIGDGAGIYANHDQDWNTRTDAPSDWRDVWSDVAEEAWIAHGGPALLAQAGYS